MGQTEFLSFTYGKEPGVLCDFLDYLYIQEGRKRETAYNYYMTARSLAKYLKKYRKNIPCAPNEVVMKNVSAGELLSIRKEEWEQYASYYRDFVAEANGSFAVRLTVIRKLYRWLCGREGVEVPPFILEEQRPVQEQSHHTSVTPRMREDILQGLRGQFTVRNACIISLVLEYGLGLGEIAALDLADLDLTGLRVKSEGSKPAGYIKFGEEMTSLMNEYLAERIPPIDGEDPLFVSAKKGRMKRGAIQKMLRKAVKSAGITNKRVSFRDLRETGRETVLVRDGVEDLMGISGLKSRWYLECKASIAKQRRAAV